VNRRQFLKRIAVTGLATTGVAAVGAAHAFVLEPQWIDVEHVTIPICRLPRSFDGIRIVLISDTHCGPWTRPAYVAKAVAMANAQFPDLVLLLGDYCHRHRRTIGPGIEPFADLKASDGVFAVLGNHDHWEGAAETRRELKRAGVAELCNRSAALSRGTGRLAIGGVDDLWEGTQAPAKAFADTPPDAPRILMSHNPDYAEALPPDVRVDLMVSGHTHGGQVWLPGVGAPLLPSRYGQKYRAGFVQAPRCKVYVTRGIGTITPPVRFLCRPELTVLTLVTL